MGDQALGGTLVDGDLAEWGLPAAGGPDRGPGAQARVIGAEQKIKGAAKYAFPGQGGGSRIDVTARIRTGDVLILRFGDNGVGKAEGVAAGGQVGSMIVKSLVAQLGAEMKVDDSSGRQIDLKIPLKTG